MNRKQSNNRADKFSSARRWMRGLGGVAVLFHALAGPAIAGPFDGAMGNTKYVVKTGDVNDDGQNDVLMLAVPKLVPISIDDDLDVLIPLPIPSPTFALLSTGYGTYTLVTDPDPDMIASVKWTAASQGIAYAGPNGQFAASVTITAATPDQAGFVVSMDANTGILQITSTLAPASGGATNVGGTKSYTYDANGRVHTVTYPSGVRVTYTYDAVGNRTSTLKQ